MRFSIAAHHAHQCPERGGNTLCLPAANDVADVKERGEARRPQPPLFEARQQHLPVRRAAQDTQQLCVAFVAHLEKGAGCWGRSKEERYSHEKVNTDGGIKLRG